MDQKLNLSEKMSEWRRHLHRNPELSGNEVETSRFIAETLETFGLKPKLSVEGRCVTVDLEGLNPAKKIAFRADCDALPILERSGDEFASAVPGVMHACGHDAHTATQIGLAALLSEQKPSTNVRLIFQPAEETLQGAKEVIAAGLVDDLDAIFGLHFVPNCQTGEILVEPGVVMASADSFDISITGQASHAARPQEGKDSIVCAARIVESVQTIVSREIAPSDLGLISICKLEAGNSRNIIAESAVLSGTIRAHDKEIRKKLKSRFKETVKSTASSLGMSAEIEFVSSSPPLENHSVLSKFAVQQAKAAKGVEKVLESAPPSMGAEDFAYYSENIPGCYVKVGSRIADYPYYPLHSDRYRLNEKAMDIALAYLLKVAENADNLSITK